MWTWGGAPLAYRAASGGNTVTVMLAVAAILLCFGSVLVLRALIEADGPDLREAPLPAEQPDAMREHRRAA
jgi:hypothetical protein